nr:MAG TPA: hypothetical protein [Caudoviricetes sp.]
MGVEGAGRRGRFSSGDRGKAILEGAGQRGVSHQAIVLGWG